MMEILNNILTPISFTILGVCFMICVTIILYSKGQTNYYLRTERNPFNGNTEKETEFISKGKNGK